MARCQSISGAVVMVEKYFCANVWAKGFARQVGECLHAFYERDSARFYDAHLDSCCFGALAIMDSSANFRLVHVF